MVGKVQLMYPYSIRVTYKVVQDIFYFPTMITLQLTSIYVASVAQPNINNTMAASTACETAAALILRTVQILLLYSRLETLRLREDLFFTLAGYRIFGWETCSEIELLFSIDLTNLNNERLSQKHDIKSVNEIGNTQIGPNLDTYANK